MQRETVKTLFENKLFTETEKKSFFFKRKKEDFLRIGILELDKPHIYGTQKKKCVEQKDGKKVQLVFHQTTEGETGIVVVEWICLIADQTQKDDLTV